MLVLLAGLLGPHGVLAQNSFTVNATGDTVDANVGDGQCSTGQQTPGGAPECTVRAALQEANRDEAQDTLRFDTLPRDRSGAARITPASGLEATEPVVVDGTTAPSHDVVAEGDLRGRIGSIEQNMPGAGSEGFEVPTTSELDAWTALAKRILEGEIQAARSIIEQQLPSYALVRFHDTVTGQPYWLLHETPTVERGWGALVVNPTPDRNLAVEVPHPVFDLDTHTQGADLFRFTGARVLVLAGTHRCANSAPSPCDGQTSVCGASGPYKVSDMAHFVEAPFQALHRTLTQRFSGLRTLNLHGNGNSSCETVFLSDGVEDTAPALIQDLQSALTDQGVDAGTPQTSSCPLEGTTNVQGRYTNGSSTPCTTPASETVGTFVHVEQRRGFRDDPEEYQALIDAVNAVVPELSTGEQDPLDITQRSSSEGPVAVLDGSELSSGVSTFSLAGPGAAGSEVRGLSLINAPAAGLRGRASDLSIRDCYVGFRPSGEAAPNGHTPGGARVGALDLDGPGVTIAGNVVSGNASAGIVAFGPEGTVRDNIVGAAPDLQTVVPNAGTGLVTGGKGTSVQANVLFGNGGHGIRVEQEAGVQIGYGYAADLPDAPAPPGSGDGNVVTQSDSAGVLLTTGSGTTIRGNRIYGNGTAGIRIAGPYDGNDERDTDEGVNRGQNVPLVEGTSGCDDGGSDTTVDVQYRVRSIADSATGSDYGDQGLAVDFYAAPDGQQQGRTYLGTDRYPQSEAGETVTAPLSADDVTCTDSLVATATDASGNTSQFNSSSVLPVELASFEASQVGERSVRLSWATSSEQNNAGFRVEHRPPQETGWAQVGSVEGAGTTSRPQRYQFRVPSLSPGAHAFRLRQVDLDGSTEVHGPVRVEVGLSERLLLRPPSPNPAGRQATVQFATRDGGSAQLVLYDALGRQVRTAYEGTVPAGQVETVRLDTKDLSSGRYFLRLTGPDKAVRTRSFSVVR